MGTPLSTWFNSFQKKLNLKNKYDVLISLYTDGNYPGVTSW